MKRAGDPEYSLPTESADEISPPLRKVIENPHGAFQRWKRGEITYLQMCGDFTKELTLARMATQPEPETPTPAPTKAQLI